MGWGLGKKGSCSSIGAVALEENGPRVAKEEVLSEGGKRPLCLAKEILLQAENKAAEVKGRDRMLKIVWLRAERNLLIVMTGECSGDRFKGTPDKERITRLKIARREWCSLRLCHCLEKQPCLTGGSPRSPSSCTIWCQRPAHRVGRPEGQPLTQARSFLESSALSQ